MFNPNLTTELAVGRAGEIQRRTELIFGPDHAVVRSLKETGDRVAAELVRAGDLAPLAHSFMPITDVGTRFLKARVDSSTQHLSALIEPLDLLENFHPDLPVIIEELALNAFEHGTDYCINGSVNVWGIQGSEAGVFGIDQRPSSVTAFTLLEKIRNTKEADFRYSRSSSRIGGIGLWQASGQPVVEVNFEDIPGGLRTLIFTERKIFSTPVSPQLEGSNRDRIEMRKIRDWFIKLGRAERRQALDTTPLSKEEFELIYEVYIDGWSRKGLAIDNKVPLEDILIIEERALRRLHDHHGS